MKKTFWTIISLIAILGFGSVAFSSGELGSWLDPIVDQGHLTEGDSEITGDLTVGGNAWIDDTSSSTKDFTSLFEFNTDYACDPDEGQMCWDDDEGCYLIGLDGGVVKLCVGKEEVFDVVNKTGATLENGTVVYANGSQGNVLTVKPADYEDADRIHILGMLTEDIGNNQKGKVTNRGRVRGDTTYPIDCNTIAEGDDLYLTNTSTSPFNWTDTHPSQATQAVIKFGSVIKSHATDCIIEMTNPQAFTIGNNFNGTMRQSIINLSTGTSAATGFTAVNDEGHFATFGIAGSNNTTFPNEVGVLYSPGYGDFWQAVDGAKDFVWFTDPTDSHDFSALSYERMRLEADGELILKTMSNDTPTYTSIQDWFNTTQSAGKIDGGEFTSTGDGTLTVAGGHGIIKTGSLATSTNVFFDWTATTTLALADDTTNYIYIDYNSGDPEIKASITKTDANNRDKILLGKVFREATVLHLVEAGMLIAEIPRNTLTYLTQMFGEVARASGYVVSEVGERYLATTNGVLFAGLTRLTTTGIDTSGIDTFEYYYYDPDLDGGSWVENSASQIDNANYNKIDDNNGLVALTSNRYGVHWVYGDPDGHLMVVYGQGNYTLVQATNAKPLSSLPNHISEFGFLAAKIIVQEGQANLYALDNIEKNPITSSGAADHGELGGLNDVADHPYALLHNGTRALTGVWDLGNFALTNVNIDSGDINTAVTQTEWDAAYSHISNNGSDHSYIDQDVTIGSSPTFANLTIPGTITALEINSVTVTSTNSEVNGNSTSTGYFMVGGGFDLDLFDYVAGDGIFSNNLEVDGALHVAGDATMANASISGSITDYWGSPCTNQVVTDIADNGTLQCTTVDISAMTNLAVS